MPETTGRDGGRRAEGGTALIGVALAMIGALAGVHAANALLVAMNEVLPQLAAVSEPPGVRRK